MTDEEAIRIAPLRPRHAAAVAELHRIALPKGFLSRLGDPFLARLYGEIAKAPRSGVWTALDGDDECVGFISGTADVSACYRHVMGNAALPLVLRACPSLRSPSTLKKIGETLLYPLRSRSHPSAPTHDSGNAPDPARRADVRAELLSLAVGAKARRRGVARRLVSVLEEHFAQWEVSPLYRVVTDAGDPRSNRFYRSVGFAHAFDFRHHGHSMSRYHKPVAAAGRRAPA